MVRLSDLHRGRCFSRPICRMCVLSTCDCKWPKHRTGWHRTEQTFCAEGQRGRTFKSLDGHEVQINDEQKFHYVVLNARCAPAADVATLLKLERGPGFVAECIQANKEMQRSMHL